MRFSTQSSNNECEHQLGVQVSAELDVSSIPMLDGAVDCVAAGVLSSIHSQNAKASAAVTNAEEAIQHESWPLLVDAQTGRAIRVTCVPLSLAEAKFFWTNRDLHAASVDKFAIMSQSLCSRF